MEEGKSKGLQYWRRGGNLGDGWITVTIWVYRGAGPAGMEASSKPSGGLLDAGRRESKTTPKSIFIMIVRESESTNMGRGAYDTTGTPKPPPPKPKRL
ncbi:hypothetical protein K504DRAFT_497792 [Pleomassaria siparia CBS 279.74]|uniref:Uncharacterized protein n=1 Tax=Pleomassaria siparia CBS 279.74 TaxID=1314801 RepID=A0A6G1KJ76_9PLEO|nr:hypothetical protein K504DRAFT_497792 [Pleomassaria siparia CBS 279.74]